jgi:hypothetical protein
MSAAPRSSRARLGGALALAALAGACGVGRRGTVTGGAGPSTGTADVPGNGSGNGGQTVISGAAGFVAGDESPTPGSGGAESIMAVPGTAGTSSTGSGGVPGAAGSNTSLGGTDDAGSDAGGFSPADASAVSDAGPSCIVTITPLVPSSLSDLQAGQVLRLQATVSGYEGADGGAPRWDWSVTMSSAGALAAQNISPMGDSGATIDVTLGAAGMYQVEARIEGAPACDREPLVLHVKPAQTPAYLFRVTPPAASQLPVRELVVPATFVGEGPQTLDLGDVRSSEVVSLSPVDARGFSVPSYMRITSPSFTFDIEGHTGRGALVTPLAIALVYDVLIVPDDAGLAPLIVSGTPDAVAAKMAIGAGITVTGALRDGGGNAVAGGRVVLRSGPRPSTVGVSGADGAFALSTRDGVLSADLYPPDGSGLPEAHVDGAPGVLLLPGMTTLDLAMDWGKVSASTLDVTVTAPAEGTPPVAGARVRAELAAVLPNVGTLHVHGPTAADLTATGTAQAEATTDAQGVAHLGLLPRGMYHVVVAPPDGAPGAAITVKDVSLGATSGALAVPLAVPLTFTGALTPEKAAAGAKITAIDRGLLAAVTVPTATAGPDGRYTLALAAGRSYELLVEPNPALGLARGVVDVVEPATGDGPHVEPVPPALIWKGAITSAGHAVGGALVQAYCGPTMSLCLDQTMAVAQAVTAPDGSLTLALPGPPAGP